MRSGLESEKKRKKSSPSHHLIKKLQTYMVQAEQKTSEAMFCDKTLYD
jgi:hypothetical protein